MTTNKVTAEKTCEFLLYFVLLMVYSGVFYLLGFDITGESSDWHIILYFLVLNIVTTPTTSLIMRNGTSASSERDLKGGALVSSAPIKKVRQ